jgi:hypothetical protein
MGNTNIITKKWTLPVTTVDCPFNPVRPQPKFPRRDGVRILEREEKTPRGAVTFPAGKLIGGAVSGSSE